MTANGFMLVLRLKIEESPMLVWIMDTYSGVQKVLVNVCRALGRGASEVLLTRRLPFSLVVNLDDT
jgi:hypothetical protein